MEGTALDTALIALGNALRVDPGVSDDTKAAASGLVDAAASDQAGWIALARAALGEQPTD